MPPRSRPMPRDSGFQPSGPWSRSVPLLSDMAVTGETKGKGAATRSSRLNPVSGKRRAENRERRAMAERRFPEMNPRCAVPWCTRPADALHEILSRARGGSITDPENTVPACNICNEALTHEPDWGYRLGLIKHSGLCCQGRRVCSRYAEDGAA